jgi:hypothetical protein
MMCYGALPVAESDRMMKHRTVDYDVQEGQPGLWRWNIYPPGRTVQGPLKFRPRELAVEACLEEINNGIERIQRRLRGVV